MLALAHHVAEAIDAGQLADQAAVARALGFTRARLSQLLNLTLLAPDIQEAVLHLEAIDGIEPMPERDLRSLRGLPWADQRRCWNRLAGAIADSWGGNNCCNAPSRLPLGASR
jgi:hypothetical protein